MKSLLAKLEAATEGSRDLDVAIATEIGWTPYLNKSRRAAGAEWSHSHNGIWHLVHATGAVSKEAHTPRFSTSLDAAMTLVPEGMSWAVSSTAIKDSDMLHEAQVNWEPSVQAATSVLALAIAALRTRGETE